MYRQSTSTKQRKRYKSLALSKPCISFTSAEPYQESKDNAIVRKVDPKTFKHGDFDSVKQNIVLPSVVDVLSPRSRTISFNFKPRK